MIIESVLGVVINLLSSLFGLLPSLPDMPLVITTYFNQFIDIFNVGISFLMYFVNSEVLIACLGVSLALFLFDEFYDIILWFLKKIPFLGIK